MITIAAAGIPTYAAAQPAVRLPTYFGAIPRDAALSVWDRVRAANASGLDATLPRVRMDEWLSVALARLVDPPGTVLTNWHVTFCDTRGTALGALRELCADAAVALTAERTVHVIVHAADFLSDPADRVSWRPTALDVRNIYVERRIDGRPVDSVHVSSLADLPQSLLVPPELWPAIDLAATISASNSAPLAGETVRFTIEVTNRGSRAITRAWVRATVDRDGASQSLQDWFPSLGAGETVRLQFATLLPAGRATVVVKATPAQTTETFGDNVGRHDPAVLLVGGGSWPRQ